jgi:UDP-N-acetylglucosamine acyltransferase
VIPFCLIAGYPAKHYRLNTIGLKRSGITGDRYKIISIAFRRLRNNESIDDLEDTEEIAYLKQWLAIKSKRGLHGFMGLGQK